ncbi:type VII toxin-antitoxin system HepT family RNase toxin [Candidatus Nitrosacidococcus tergens]|uniref:Toxin-antitoxin antitoxin component n=1 Tax=Candidatus Nitrosacidococcus tergens TaxID=553981 RepID=A0A7G1Q9K6_9GAMM|nr:DUF86 domain-containing protein [Candidatus Nitrosacidococcus tergens]CAB1275799.1 conserved protein of unknown function [Candidatus Nitrosacidococcus tergens]
MDDVLLNKIAMIERCLARIKEEYHDDETELETNFTRQDSIVLNLQRACEAAISLAMHVVRAHRLGTPQESRDGFELLYQAEIIDETLCQQMKKMVGFRNIAVHQYEKLNLLIIHYIIENNLNDFLKFTQIILKQAKKQPP